METNESYYYYYYYYYCCYYYYYYYCCCHVAVWCDPTPHISGIGMESTLQHGVNRHCLTKAYLWHVCKAPVRRSIVTSFTAQQSYTLVPRCAT